MFAILLGPRPDVLFIEGQPLSLGLVGLFMKWFRGVPYIFHMPDLQVDVAKQLGFIKSKVFLNLAFHLEALCLKKAWKVSTSTFGMVRRLRKQGLPWEQITLLPNGVDSDLLRPKSANQDLLDRWDIRDRKVFTFVGTFSFYQGLDTILYAARLLKGRKDLVFVMIGNGPERSRMIKTAENLELPNVIFDELPYEKLADIYSITYAAIASVLDIPVTRTMLPAKIMPPLSCGVPVIYAGEGEAADLINTNNCGICARPEDGEGLAEAITQLAADPKDRNKKGLAGRTVVVSEYDSKVIVTRWCHQLGIERRKD
jgi:glycosyltransferase involved in cell wall biosynthesis